MKLHSQLFLLYQSLKQTGSILCIFTKMKMTWYLFAQIAQLITDAVPVCVTVIMINF